MRIPILIFVVVLAAFSGTLRATTVVSNQNLVWTKLASPFLGAEYQATIYQDAARTDPTSVLFDHNSTTLDAVTWNVDESSWWYFVNYNQEFSAATIPTASFTPVLTHDGPGGGGVSPPFAIPVGGFYLAFHTYQTRYPYSNHATVYGWVALWNTGSAIVMLDNAIAYDTQGIIVGTTTAVPEPFGSFALVLGAAMLLPRRRPRLR